MDVRADLDRLIGAPYGPATPGLALGLAVDGEVVHTAGYGMADLAHGRPVELGTPFHVASVSKQFVACAAARVAADGQLDLDGDIRTWLPELGELGRGITPRHLVHHTSGLRDQWELLVLSGCRLEDVITTVDVLELVHAQRGRAFEPGTEHLYCNTGYTLLGCLVERVTGTSLREWSRTQLFEPLGMVSTHWHDDHREIVAGGARSYATAPGGVYQEARLAFGTIGATGLWSTVSDLLRWMTGLRTGALGDPRLWASLRQPGRLADGTPLAYAFGMEVLRHRGTTLVGHAGADAGYRAYAGTLPDHGVDVVVMANLAGTDAAGIALAAADLVVGDRLGPDVPPCMDSAPCRWIGRYLDAATGVVHHVDEHPCGLALRGLTPQPLVPTGDGAFELRATPTVGVRFEDGLDGPILVGSGALRTTAHRIEGLDLPVEALRRFVGEYRSAELAVTLTIELTEDDDQPQLRLRRRRYGPALLQAVGQGTFRGRLDSWSDLRATLRFEPSAGAADTLLVTTPRAWRIRFTRERSS